MKRIVCALMTAAAVTGCQTYSSEMVGQGHSDAGYSHSLPSPAGKAAADAKSAQRPVQKSLFGKNTESPEIQQVGYNQGHGAMQNRKFAQRVARAVPSHPAPPVSQRVAGGMPGHAGCQHCGPGGHMMPGMPGMPTAGIPMPGGLGPRFSVGRTQVRFTEPLGMNIAWQTSDPSAPGGFTPPQLEVPNRYNFRQGSIYRLKLTNIENRNGLVLYPTLEVYPGNAKVDAYLAHNAVPVQFLAEDFDQAVAGNYVTKVIYLPDARYQELAIQGVETLVSTRLDPGVDPVQEAHRRGAVLAVIRMGAVNLEMKHSPSLFMTPEEAASMMMPPASSQPIMMPASSQPIMMPVDSKQPASMPMKSR